MRNMTLWSAAGISVAAAAVSMSGSETADTLRWLVDLCLTGPMPDDMPMIEFETRGPSPTVALGLGLISASLLIGGLWPGAAGTDRSTEADPDRMLAAMAHVAAATGGISPPELAEKVTRATGMTLSVNEATLALKSYGPEASDDDLNWIAEEGTRATRETIMRAALEVGWTHGAFTPGGLEMIGRLARALDFSGDDLALLFWETTEPQGLDLEDPTARLRPKSKMLRGATPAPA